MKGHVYSLLFQNSPFKVYHFFAVVPFLLLTITRGTCLIVDSISQLIPVTVTWNLAAMSHTVAPEPGPLARSAILAIFNASSACGSPPATASGVGLFLNLNILPMT